MGKAKKAINKVVKKLTLGNPSTKNYEICSNETQLKDVIQNELDELKVPLKPSIPYELVRNKSKDERKLLRDQYKMKTDCRKYVRYGVNSVNKLLTSNQAAFVLLKHNIDSYLIIDHIIALCKNNQVPYLLITDLDKALIKGTNTGATAFAILKEFPHDSNKQLFNLLQKCKEISSETHEKLDQSVIECGSANESVMIIEENATPTAIVEDSVNIEKKKKKKKVKKDMKPEYAPMKVIAVKNNPKRKKSKQ